MTPYLPSWQVFIERIHVNSKGKTTVINGVNFGPIWGMSGIENFFGEGYRYHRLLKNYLGMSFEGMTFVAKTTTFNVREGQMPLGYDLQPKERFPKSIYVDPFRAIVLNAVSLSGPGLIELFNRREWQARRTPFFISFMSVEDDEKKYFEEIDLFVFEIAKRIKFFKTPFGIQLNISCPNTGHDLSTLAERAQRMLDLMDPLVLRGVTIVVKIAVDMPYETAIRISQHPNCHAICVSNTIPFGKEIPHFSADEQIPWKKLFPKGSPLLRRGLKLPGGLSGTLLQPLVVKWVKEAVTRGLEKPINAGGGILKPEHVEELFEAGASSVSIGSIVMLRPWMVNAVIAEAHQPHRTQLPNPVLQTS